jgi:hypothetical protein
MKELFFVASQTARTLYTHEKYSLEEVVWHHQKLVSSS